MLGPSNISSPEQNSRDGGWVSVGVRVLLADNCHRSAQKSTFARWVMDGGSTARGPNSYSGSAQKLNFPRWGVFGAQALL